MSLFYSKKKVLVTGGCGFVGSYLCEALDNCGAIVDVIDNFSSSSPNNLKFLGGRVKIIEGDCRDRSFVSANIKEYDCVFNLAGMAYGVAFSNSHNAESFYNNTLIQLNVLDACRGNRIKRVLMVSSSCVYSDDAPCPTPELPTFVGEPESSNSGYGWAKRVGELASKLYKEDYGLEVSIVRPINIYGERYLWHGSNSHVIPSLVKRVMDGDDPLVVWGSGEQSRDFIHAYDVARMMMIILENKHDGEPVNLGLGNEIKIKDLVNLICKVCKKKPNVMFDKTKPQGSYRKVSDNGLLRKVIGDYKQSISLEDGIYKMLDWYEENKRKNK